MPAWPGENFTVVESFIAHTPPPTLPRQRGRGQIAASKRTLPCLPGREGPSAQRWEGGGILPSLQHAFAGAGDAFDRSEPIRQFAGRGLDQDMADANCFIFLQPDA